MISPTPLQLTLMEAMWTLRRLKAVEGQLSDDMLAIEERIRGQHDGDLATVHHILEGERHIARSIISKLWLCVGVPIT